MPQYSVINDFPNTKPTATKLTVIDMTFCLFVYLSVNSAYFPHLHHVLKCCDEQN